MCVNCTQMKSNNNITAVMHLMFSFLPQCFQHPSQSLWLYQIHCCPGLQSNVGRAPDNALPLFRWWHLGATSTLPQDYRQQKKEEWTFSLTEQGRNFFALYTQKQNLGSKSILYIVLPQECQGALQMCYTYMRIPIILSSLTSGNTWHSPVS